MKHNTEIASVGHWIQIQSLVAQNSDLADLTFRADKDLASLSGPERTRVMAVISTWAMTSEAIWTAGNEGGFSDTYMTPLRTDWLQRMRSASYREYFREYGSRYHSQAFNNFVNSLIQEVDAP